MDRETFERKEKEILNTFRQKAWENFKENYKPRIYEIAVPSVFGKPMQTKISNFQKELMETYGNDFSAIITFAVREYELACYTEALFYKLCIEAGVMLDNSYTREHASAEGYAETLYNHLSQLNKSIDYLDGTPFTEIPNIIDVLRAISLYWFNEAAINFTNQNIEKCFIYLDEAYSAQSLIDYEETFYMLGEETKNNRSREARRAALEKWKHDPRQKEKHFVFECWQEWQQNSERYPSKAAFARDMLEKCENLISYKKIEDWCREWEKSNPAS